MDGRVSNCNSARKMLGESPVCCEVYTGLIEGGWSFILAALAGVFVISKNGIGAARREAPELDEFLLACEGIRMTGTQSRRR